MKNKVFSLATMRIIGVIMVSLWLALAPKSVYAYEPDTHYQLTYVLCRAAGLNHNDALTVAQCDQGMDDSDGTLANHGPGGTIPKPQEEGLWHAIPVFPDPNTVLTRKELMFQYAIRMPDRLRKLQYLGVFFHYQQDTWAHREHPNASAVGFKTYFQPLGHATEVHQPDRPPFDPVCALRCLEEGIAYVRRFMTEGLKETPSALFNNYSPAAGNVDTAWPGKGMYINQILIDKSNTAREFTTSLIRTQIDAYTNGLDANPRWGGRYTSNEAAYSVVRDNFQRVCAQFNVSVQIPAYLVPLSTLTTPMIQGGGVLPIPPVAVAELFITLKSAKNNQFLCATDGLRYNEWLYCKEGTPVTFLVEGTIENCNLRVKGEPLYFSYKESTGSVKLWNTAEGANFRIEKQANGKYAIKSLKYNQYVWLSGESPYITKAGRANNDEGQWIISGLESNTLKAGENLNKGQRITSANGQYYLFMQEDGNLCIYKTADNGFVWASMAYGFQGATLKMQTDGNLVVYDGSNAAKWSSKTHPAYDTKFSNNLNVPVKVVLEDTGKLVLYNAAGSAMWSSK